MKTLLLLLLITVSEATIGVFVKLTDGLIPIQTLTFYAMAFAAAFLFVARALASGEWPRFPKGNVRDTAIIGALIAAQGSAFNFAMTLVPIANAVIFWSIAPFFVFIFSALFLGEKARKSYLLIFAIALTGIAIANPLGNGNALGNFVALATGAIYAAMVTYMRYEGKTETGNDIAWSLLAAALALSPALIIAGPGKVAATISYTALGMEVPVMLWAAGLGIISTGFAYFGISIVLKSINANVYALTDIIVSPVVAATLGYLIFAEIPGEGMLYGGAMLLGAGFWLSWEMSKTDRQRAVHACQCA
ncbi:Threonine/homoserine efflux transporter RhtA [Modicisalibacter ilicicola DSM 19980]|uniref:Threonine/homoserine efflux transporter RhtA n=1 Tax=Modicisalibacter ilicicola DSM 19980 TaxID=1121942 RepID=A0A1M5DL84_9GAMM|nr:DMT family transporter [Halomonas ilicicola]SHF67710.1 Threonine/homoserine efflux transporter RhtA [Halomonas ilicicola DSM 19980]